MQANPVLKLATKAARQGSAMTRFRVTPDEANQIREAEAAGGHQAGLVVVLQILRDRNKSPESSVVGQFEF